LPRQQKRETLTHVHLSLQPSSGMCLH